MNDFVRVRLVTLYGKIIQTSVNQITHIYNIIRKLITETLLKDKKIDNFQ